MLGEIIISIVAEDISVDFIGRRSFRALSYSFEIVFFIYIFVSKQEMINSIYWSDISLLILRIGLRFRILHLLLTSFAFCSGLERAPLKQANTKSYSSFSAETRFSCANCRGSTDLFRFFAYFFAILFDCTPPCG